jgi:hypothetical protein
VAITRSPNTSPQGAEGLVAGEDHGAALVAARGQLKEEVRALALDRQVADLVDDQEPRHGAELELLLEPALGDARSAAAPRAHRADPGLKDKRKAGVIKKTETES